MLEISNPSLVLLPFLFYQASLHGRNLLADYSGSGPLNPVVDT